MFPWINMPKNLHCQLQSIGKKFHLPGATGGGYCNGLTLKWLEACFLGDLELQRFFARVETLLTIKTSNLFTQIKAVKKKWGANLTEADIALLEIQALLEGIEIYQYPNNFKHLFGTTLNQLNYAEMSQLAGSRGIDALGGLVTIYSEPNVLCTDEITSYLNRLKKILDDNHTPNKHVGIILGNIEHTMGLSYNLTTQVWSLMNSEHWPPFESIKTAHIAQKIMDGFNPKYTHPYIAFDTTIICPLKQQSETLNAKLLDLRSVHLSTLPKDINKRFSKVSLITITALFGHLDFVNALLTNGDIEASVEDKSKALILAVQEGYFEIAKTLLNYGANPNFQKKGNGLTPLYMAVLNENVQLASMLLIHGADPDLAVDERTPLAKAAIKGNIDLVHTLILHHANPHIEDSDGDTPYSFAEKYNHTEVLICLSDWIEQYNNQMMSIAIEISLHAEVIIYLIDQLNASKNELTITSRNGFFSPPPSDPNPKRVKLSPADEEPVSDQSVASVP